MSPWWREVITAQLAPDEVTLVHRSRGLQRRELERQTLTAASADSASWHNIVEAMNTYLEARQWRNAGLCVTLRGDFVRYLALPWVEKLSEREDRKSDV